MNRDYNFNKFAGIQPATREALNWIFENGGLPMIKGRWFFVDPDNGSASASGDADAPVSSLQYAYDLCTSGAGTVFKNCLFNYSLSTTTPAAAHLVSGSNDEIILFNCASCQVTAWGTSVYANMIAPTAAAGGGLMTTV